MSQANREIGLLSLQDYALEAFVRLKARLSRPHQPASSWPLAPADLERTEILWPRRYGWEAAATWAESIRRGLTRFVDLRAEDIGQSIPGVVQFVVKYDRHYHQVAMDYSDKQTVTPAIVGQFDTYFKLQFASNGYHSPRLLPGGFVSYPLLYDIWPSVAAISRTWEKQYDVFGRFAVDFATEVRTHAVRILRKADRFQYEGGLVKKRYVGYLYDICRSKICVDLPGNGPFCFRLVDYFAMGACVVAFPHESRFHVPIEDGEHIVYMKEDLSDLEDKCIYYLENKEERQRIGRNAQEFFVNFLYRDQLAAYYLYEIYRRLGV